MLRCTRSTSSELTLSVGVSNDGFYMSEPWEYFVASRVTQGEFFDYEYG
jgi:hypothetical protein